MNFRIENYPSKKKSKLLFHQLSIHTCKTLSPSSSLYLRDPSRSLKLQTLIFLCFRTAMHGKTTRYTQMRRGRLILRPIQRPLTPLIPLTPCRPQVTQINSLNPLNPLYPLFLLLPVRLLTPVTPLPLTAC